MKRRMRPRSPLVTPALVVTDQNAMAVVGLEPRQFRELVARRKIPHTRDGQRVLVRADVLLDALASAEHAGHIDAPHEGADEPTTAAEVLRALGLRRSA